MLNTNRKTQEQIAITNQIEAWGKHFQDINSFSECNAMGIEDDKKITCSLGGPNVWASLEYFSYDDSYTIYVEGHYNQYSDQQGFRISNELGQEIEDILYNM